MNKFFMRQRGFLLFVVRAIARVLHRQRGSDNEHFFERPFPFGGDQHTRNGWINRKLCELPAQCGEALILIHGTELKQLPVAVFDHARARRLDEREIFYISEAE